MESNGAAIRFKRRCYIERQNTNTRARSLARTQTRRQSNYRKLYFHVLLIKTPPLRPYSFGGGGGGGGGGGVVIFLRAAFSDRMLYEEETKLFF